MRGKSVIESDGLFESLPEETEEIWEDPAKFRELVVASVDGFGEFSSAGVTEWQNTASMDGLGESPSAGGTEWQNTPSVDGFEWLNTPSVDGTCAGGTEWQNTLSVDGFASLVVGSETRIGFCVFCSMDTFSAFLENTHQECSFSGENVWCILIHDFYLHSVLVSFPSKTASERANRFD